MEIYDIMCTDEATCKCLLHGGGREPWLTYPQAQEGILASPHYCHSLTYGHLTCLLSKQICDPLDNLCGSQKKPFALLFTHKIADWNELKDYWSWSDSHQWTELQVCQRLTPQSMLNLEAATLMETTASMGGTLMLLGKVWSKRNVFLWWSFPPLELPHRGPRLPTKCPYTNRPSTSGLKPLWGHSNSAICPGPLRCI